MFRYNDEIDHCFTHQVLRAPYDVYQIHPSTQPRVSRFGFGQLQHHPTYRLWRNQISFCIDGWHTTMHQLHQVEQRFPMLSMELWWTVQRQTVLFPKTVDNEKNRQTDSQIVPSAVMSSIWFDERVWFRQVVCIVKVSNGWWRRWWRTEVCDGRSRMKRLSLVRSVSRLSTKPSQATISSQLFLVLSWQSMF